MIPAYDYRLKLPLSSATIRQETIFITVYWCSQKYNVNILNWRIISGSAPYLHVCLCYVHETHINGINFCILLRTVYDFSTQLIPIYNRMQKQNKRRVHFPGFMSIHTPIRLSRNCVRALQSTRWGNAGHRDSPEGCVQHGRQDVLRYEGHRVRSCRNKGEAYRRLDVRRHAGKSEHPTTDVSKWHAEM